MKKLFNVDQLSVMILAGHTLHQKTMRMKKKGNMKGDTLKAIVGHVCFYCHHSFDQTKDNPSRTDFCVKCGHRGEGIKRTLEKRDWGILHVRPND